MIFHDLSIGEATAKTELLTSCQWGVLGGTMTRSHTTAETCTCSFHISRLLTASQNTATAAYGIGSMVLVYILTLGVY